MIAYVSKRLPEVAQNYSNTELVLCCLAINIDIFAHLLINKDVDAIMDSTHIIKIKAEAATNRIKRLLEALSSYSFNLYYIKR